MLDIFHVIIIIATSTFITTIMIIGRPWLTWLGDIVKCTGVETYEKVKRAAEGKSRWRIIVVNLLTEDDKW